MKVHPIPHVKVYFNFASLCSVSWRITPLYFFNSNPYTLDKKQFWEWLGENSPNSLCYVWNHKSDFLQTLHHSSMSWEISRLYSFYLKLYMVWKKEHIKVQNFRLSTAHVKFHQIGTLINSFCWKYIKFQLKKYRGVLSHELEVWCKIWRKTHLLFQKW